MELKEVKAVCKEMELHCKPEGGHIKDWYIYTPNQSRWIACYYTLFGQAVIYNSGEPFFTDKDEFKEYYEKFPKLNFFVYDYNYNFELTKEDLFVKVNHEYYFLIIFKKSVFDHSDLAFWNLGLPFLKKYEFVHNYEEQNIGFYIPYQEPEEDDDDEKIPEKPPKEAEKKEEKKDSNGNTKSYVWIIVGVVIIVIILVVGAFCVAKNMYGKRKGKANELEDDFVYDSENKEKKTIN